MFGFRPSKYKHVYGQGVKKELSYDNVKVTKNAWDSNLIKVNPLYLSVNWDAAGGGAFAVIPLTERGKLPDLIPLFKGHSAPVLDTDFNPFNDSVIASGSDDGNICLWTVPSDFTVLEKDAPDIDPVSKLSGHSRKVGNVTFHPCADNVLASTSGDHTLKMWDIVKSSNQLTLKHPDMIQSLAFNREGNLLVTTGRDKRIRIWDPRTNQVAQEAPGHAATVGFGKMSDRQLALWDVKNLSEPIGGFTMLDQSAGVIMPFYDYDTKVLYLAGKGDGNIRYYEFDNDEFWPLSEYKSSDPQRGVAFMPKRGLSVHENEVMRAYKTVHVLIEPVSFIVPRRSGSFQDDIYPDALSGEPSLTSDEWFAGRDASPRLLSMESVYQNAAGGQPSRQREFVPQSTPDVARPLEVTPKPKATETTSKVVSDQEMAQSVFKRPVSSEGDTPAPSTDSNRKEPPKETVSIVEPQSTQAKAAPVTKVSSDKESTLLPTDEVLQRLLSVVESQSQTIDAQAERIQWLEDQHKQYLTAFSALESKLEDLSTANRGKGHGDFEDDEGAFIEV